jgi:hypothetical protein
MSLLAVMSVKNILNTPRLLSAARRARVGEEDPAMGSPWTAPFGS